MMIGSATPTVEPLAGATLGGPNGAVPVNGVGSCAAAGPATIPGSPGAGSASAGPAPSTSTQPNIDATPTAVRAVRPFVQPDILIPPVAFWKQSRIAPRSAISSAPGVTGPTPGPVT